MLSGRTEDLRRLQDRLKELKVRGVFLRVSAAFHSRYLAPMKDEFRAELEKLDWNINPAVSVLRNIDCSVYKTREDLLYGLVEQLTAPVLFYQGLAQAITHYGQDSFVEFGHKPVLQKMLEATYEEQAPEARKLDYRFLL